MPRAVRTAASRRWASAAAAFGDRLFVVAKGIDDNQIFINSARLDEPFGTWKLIQRHDG